jgi:hypothetical protein
MIGRPGYAPQDLLKLSIYRVRSGRHLEAETHRKIEVIWLLRHLKPTSRPGRFSMGRDPLSSQAGPLFGLTDDQLTIRIAAKPSLAVLRDISGIDIGAQLRPAPGQSARPPDGGIDVEGSGCGKSALPGNRASSEFILMKGPCLA